MRTRTIGTRRVDDAGRVEYVIPESDLILAMHADGWIFDVSFNAWNREIKIIMTPLGGIQ